MRKPKRWAALLALLAAVAMVLAAACGGDDDDEKETPTTAPGATTTAAASPTQPQDVKKYDTGASDTEIKIGSTTPLSGPAATYGTVGRVAEAYFKMINEQGGVNGRKITFIYKDDQYSPDKTVQAIRELVEQDKVLFVFNTLGTPPNTAIWDYLNQQKIPQLFVATGASKWGADPKSHPWTMGWLPDYQSEAAVYVAYLNKEKPNAKLAILYQNDDYGKDYVEGLKKALQSTNSKVTIVKELTYNVTDASVSAQVAQLKESNADTFYLVAIPKFATQALIAATQVGWKPLILLNSVSSSIPSVLDPAAQQGADLSNLVTTFYLKDPGDPQWANDKAMQEYLAFMKKYYPEGNPNDPYNVYGYAATKCLVEAVLKPAGNNLTRENIMKQAKSMKDVRIDILLPGILINTSETDYYPIQAMQLAMFKPAAKKWELVGQVIDTSKK